MRVFSIFFAAIIFSFSSLLSQTIDFMSINYRTGEHEQISLPATGEDFDFNKTDWYYGDSPGKLELNLERPTESDTLNGIKSGFTQLRPANSLFDVSHYPARTAVKIFSFSDGEIRPRGSGAMVGKNYVLTAEHITFTLDSTAHLVYYDSLLVIPAYGNGSENSNFESAIAAKLFLPLGTGDDLALIELHENIGLKTGWIGVGFYSDTSAYRNKVFHQFSYPATYNFLDSSRYYSGDSLYYSYGTLDVIEEHEIGYYGFGIPGESGSSLFFTDNTFYYTLGLASYAFNNKHYRIQHDMFYALRSIINKTTTSVDGTPLPQKYRLRQNYPNPFNGTTRIQFELADESFAEVVIFDLHGRHVKTLTSERLANGEHIANWNGTNEFAQPVASGVYFYRLVINSHLVESRKMLYLR
ncbi:MAG: T9SS C-terminal target domain-containing protein [Calditrichaeota bacterium]|nr:MAG: T9SS C-terminal target domain-containing protein [Calditrichota bacterium]